MSVAPVSPGLFVGVVVSAAVALFVYKRERAGDRITALQILVALLVVDAALFPDGGSENGPFVIAVRSLSFPVLFLVPVALMLVRIVAGRWNLRFTVSGLCWAGFFGWLCAEAFAGYAAHNSHPAIDQQAKLLVFLGTTAIFAAGVPAEQLLGRRGIPALVAGCVPVAVILIITKTAGLVTNGTLVPGLVHGAGTGKMGADCATVFVTLGLLGLALALTKPQGQRRGILPAIVLIVSPAFTGQRASLIGAGVGVVILAGVAVLPVGRGLFRFPARERAALLFAVLLAAGGLAVAASAHHGYNPSNSSVAHSFTSQGKADSANARVNQWKVAEQLVREKPVLGHGLGVEYNYVENVKDAPSVLVRSDLTHDIFLDMLLRTGAVGCALLVIALLATFIQGLRFIRLRVGGAALAAVGIAASAALGGWLARAVVESAFEKDRLAMALGLILGFGAAAARARQQARDVVAARPAEVGVLPSPRGAGGSGPGSWAELESYV